MRLLASVLVFVSLSLSAQAQNALSPSPVPPPTSGPSGPVQVASVPQPDPTVLTTDQLRREIAALKELIFSQVDGKFQVIVTRLDGSDKAVALLQEATDRQPARTQAAVDQLKALSDEKFAGVTLQFGGIQKQFDERDVRVEQAATGTKTAIDAALQAQEKSANDKSESAAVAIAKSEAATTKQIDSITELIAQGNEATNSKIDGLNATLNGKVDDLKARVQAMESKGEGQSIQKQDSTDNWGFAIGAGGLAIAAVMMFVTMSRAPRSRAT